MPVRRPLGDRPVRQDSRGSHFPAIAVAPPGPRRAEALSLQAILRYYHGLVPESIETGEAALEEPGADELLRARVLGRLAFLVMQLDLERGLALVEEAIILLERHRQPVDPDLLANALLLRAVAELAMVRPTRPADIERGLRLMTADGRSWEREGADGSAFGLARHADDLDRAIALTRELIRAKSGPGGDDPFNLVMLSGLLVHRGEWTEARVLAEAAMEATSGRGRTSTRRGGSAGSRSSPPTTGASTTRGGGPWPACSVQPSAATP